MRLHRAPDLLKASQQTGIQVEEFTKRSWDSPENLSTADHLEDITERSLS